MACLCVVEVAGGGCVWCHFAGPSALTWNRALPHPESYQFLEEIPVAGKHDPSTPWPSALSSLCPGACLGLNPRISSTASTNPHLQNSPLHTTPRLQPGFPTTPQPPEPTTFDVVLHAPLRKPLSLLLCHPLIPLSQI